MKIRAAHPADAGDIAALWNAMIRDTDATFTTQEKTIKGISAIILGQEAQGRGAGRGLMQQAIVGARAQGHHVMVAAISGANPGAVAFHGKLGFTTVAQMPQVGRKGGKWLDLILMQKIVSGP